jgi:hypothetical protein
VPSPSRALRGMSTAGVPVRPGHSSHSPPDSRRGAERTTAVGTLEERASERRATRGWRAGVAAHTPGTEGAASAAASCAPRPFDPKSVVHGPHGSCGTAVGDAVSGMPSPPRATFTHRNWDSRGSQELSLEIVVTLSDDCRGAPPLASSRAVTPSSRRRCATRRWRREAERPPPVDARTRLPTGDGARPDDVHLLHRRM